MILEGIVTSLNADHSVNVAPMGPIVDERLESFVLRPFKTSTTCQNLKRQPTGVFHVIDDVLLLARATIGRLDPPPEMFPAERVPGAVLASACRWYEFEIVDFDLAEDRTRLLAQVVNAGRLRDFLGFNRARHAVIEAAILASRVHVLPRETIEAQWEPLAAPIEKTAGGREREAFALLRSYIDEFFADGR
ncbi:MAG: DUF447 family protein [Planctomycetes bacterium]|nr:DUF447 family protein [Planctomycetota bacterium]